MPTCGTVAVECLVQEPFRLAGKHSGVSAKPRGGGRAVFWRGDGAFNKNEVSLSSATINNKGKGTYIKIVPSEFSITGTAGCHSSAICVWLWGDFSWRQMPPQGTKAEKQSNVWPEAQAKDESCTSPWDSSCLFRRSCPNRKLFPTPYKARCSLPFILLPSIKSKGFLANYYTPNTRNERSWLLKGNSQGPWKVKTFPQVFNTFIILFFIFISSALVRFHYFLKILRQKKGWIYCVIFIWTSRGGKIETLKTSPWNSQNITSAPIKELFLRFNVLFESHQIISIILKGKPTH